MAVVFEVTPRPSTDNPSGIVRHHARFEGIAVIPCSTGVPRKILLHAAYEREEVRFTLSSRGMAPFVPSYADVDSNRYFLGGQRAVNHAALSEDLASHLWTVHGAYSYLLLANEGLTSEMPGAKLAADITLTTDRNVSNKPSTNIPAAIWITGVLGKAQ